MQTGEWKTHDGRLLKVAEMGTHHLRKCVAMLERQIATCDMSIAVFDTMNGEMAREAAGPVVGEVTFRRHRLRAKKHELEGELSRRPPLPVVRGATRE